MPETLSTSMYKPSRTTMHRQTKPDRAPKVGASLLITSDCQRQRKRSPWRAVG